MKQSRKLKNDLFFTFTNKKDHLTNRLFSPVASYPYKYMFVHAINFDSGKKITLNGINAIEFFENQKLNNLKRITTGGRLEIRGQMWYSTVNMYIQQGNTPQGEKLLSYYIQPEIRLSHKNFTWRFGAEIISGNGPGLNSHESGNFDTLYGVAWKFMGNMNLFTRFPDDTGGKGLVNPYLFILLAPDKKLVLRSDFNLFYTLHPFINNSGNKERRYIGMENDISLKFKPTNNLELNFGFSYLISSASMQYLPKVIDFEKITIWNYLMASYSFQVVDYSNKRD